MRKALLVMVGIFLLTASPGYAKGKARAELPTFVLQARTLNILIDPQAGISVRDPQANRVAQKDVETAFLN